MLSLLAETLPMSITTLQSDEEINTLVDPATVNVETVDPFAEIRKRTEKIQQFLITYKHLKLKGAVRTKKFGKSALKIGWFSLSTAVVLPLTVALLLKPQLLETQEQPKYSIYAARPVVAGTTSYGVGKEDARAAKIDEIFKEYNCPIQGVGSVFIREADKNDIPYWLVAAVAFQESSCGKFTPKVEGTESSNLWGWGVWGEHIYQFEDVEEGIVVVSKYMNEKFYSQGVTKPCEIMRTYTPPSQGSWCEGVKFFRNQIMDYTTPKNI